MIQLNNQLIKVVCVDIILPVFDVLIVESAHINHKAFRFLSFFLQKRLVILTESLISRDLISELVVRLKKLGSLIF
jgi:hypothetical protein